MPPTPSHPAERPEAHPDGALSVACFTLGPWETNCYVAHAGGPGCVIVDAGFEPGPMIEHIRSRGLRPGVLVFTHAHPDHIAGGVRVASEFPEALVMIHQAEERWLRDPELNLSALMGIPITGPTPHQLLHDGDRIEHAGLVLRVLHTPGHSPGGISLVADEPGSGGLVFSGDALFAGSVGRTDFPGSDHDTLLHAIRDKLYPLPDDTRVLPGHGPPTTIGREKRTNPYARA